MGDAQRDLLNIGDDGDGVASPFSCDLFGFAAHAAASVLIQNWRDALRGAPEKHSIATLAADLDEVIGQLRRWKEKLQEVEEVCGICGKPYEAHSSCWDNPEPGAAGWGELCPGRPWPGEPGWRDNEGHDRWEKADWTEGPR